MIIVLARRDSHAKAGHKINYSLKFKQGHNLCVLRKFNDLLLSHHVYAHQICSSSAYWMVLDGCHAGPPLFDCSVKVLIHLSTLTHTHCCSWCILRISAQFSFKRRGREGELCSLEMNFLVHSGKDVHEPLSCFSDEMTTDKNIPWGKNIIAWFLLTPAH